MFLTAFTWWFITVERRSWKQGVTLGPSTGTSSVVPAPAAWLTWFSDSKLTYRLSSLPLASPPSDSLLPEHYLQNVGPIKSSFSKSFDGPTKTQSQPPMLDLPLEPIHSLCPPENYSLSCDLSMCFHASLSPSLYLFSGMFCPVFTSKHSLLKKKKKQLKSHHPISTHHGKLLAHYPILPVYTLYCNYLFQISVSRTRPGALKTGSRFNHLCILQAK